jgi:hypothetical protein
MKSCTMCHHNFMPKVPHQVYCSSKCCDERNNLIRINKYKRVEKQKRICIHCGIEFLDTSIKKASKFCSAACRDKDRIKNINKKWLVKDKKPISQDLSTYLSNSHAYGHNPSYLKKYNAVRG